MKSIIAFIIKLRVMKPNLTEAAVKNHEELFPDSPSTLLQTDPELVEIFNNFAFDEVLSYVR